MANKVILGGTDVVKHYESHGDVKDKTMKTNKPTIKGTEKGLQGLAENKPPAHYSPHRVRRERRGAPLGKEPNALCYAPCFPKK